MKNIFENLFLSKEVKQALAESKAALDHAMEAKTTIDSIYVTEQLAQMFWSNQDTLADTLREDYYTELLVGKMLRSKEELEAEQREKQAVTS